MLDLEHYPNFECLNELADAIHDANVQAGWWNDIETGEDIHETRNKGELMLLMVSEIIEAFEGVRKNLQDEKLPTRPAEEVEMGDLLIRFFDYAGARKLDITGAVFEKLAYNRTRKDHTREHRLSKHGKKF